jgi:hypothetical protein
VSIKSPPFLSFTLSQNKVDFMRILAALLMLMGTAFARDADGRYANTPNAEWYRSQHNSQGQWCCNEADGHPYEGNYTMNSDGSVSVEGHRIEAAKVLNGVNPTGHAVWWYLDGPNGRTSFCFAPGTLS